MWNRNKETKDPTSTIMSEALESSRTENLELKLDNSILRLGIIRTLRSVIHHGKTVPEPVQKEALIAAIQASVEIEEEVDKWKTTTST